MLSYFRVRVEQLNAASYICVGVRGFLCPVHKSGDLET